MSDLEDAMRLLTKNAFGAIDGALGSRFDGEFGGVSKLPGGGA